jgi:hypothetical protein
MRAAPPPWRSKICCLWSDLRELRFAAVWCDLIERGELLRGLPTVEWCLSTGNLAIERGSFLMGHLVLNLSIF